MKVYGSITELVSIVLRKVAKTITISPSTQTGNPTVNIPDLGDSSSHDMVLADTTQTLTNKTLTSPKVNENVALTTTATKLNYLTSAAGTTGTTSTNIVFSTSPSLTTPTLGVASATSVNKVAITAPATSATLTLADGSTLATSGAYSTTLTATGATSLTLPTTGTLATLAGTETLTNKTLTIPKYSTGTVSISSNTFARGSSTQQDITSGSGPLNTISGAAADGEIIVVRNSTGTAITVTENSGSNGFRTGTGSSISLADKQTLEMRWDNSASRWFVIGGTGSSSASSSGEINAVTNPSAASDTTGYTAGTNHTVAQDTSNSPLSPITSTSLSMTGTAATSESSTSGVYYSIGTMPSGLKNRKLKVEFYYTSPSTTNGTWKLSVYGGGTRMALSTDSSGATTIPASVTGGKFTAYFDADASTSYTVNFTHTTTAATNTLYITNLVFGPGIQPQGAAVGDLGTGLAFTTAGFGTLASSFFHARREGTVMEVHGRWTNGTVDGTAAAIILPSGYTLDTTKLSTSGPYIPVGEGYTSTGGTATDIDSASIRAVIFSDGSTTDRVFFGYQDDTSNNLRKNQGNQWSANSANISFRLRIPIAEWAGSGTVNLAQNDVEYASNSSTSTTASDTTSFAYGPAGNIIQNITAALQRRARFQTPIQSTDVLLLQVSDGGNNRWHTVGQATRVGVYAGSSAFQPFDVQNGTTYGIGLGAIINSTDVEVDFGQYAVNNSATFGGAGSAWSSNGGASTYWRVVKAKAGAAVGFGLANTTDYQAGLVRLPNGMVRLHTGNGFGSTNTKIRRFTTTVTNTGTAITYSDSASNGATFTINEAGIYSISYCDNFNSAGEQIGVSLNSSQLTTNISGITTADRLGYTVSGADVSNNYSWTGRLAAGDVIRAHTTGGTVGSIQALVNFTITQLQRF